MEEYICETQQELQNSNISEDRHSTSMEQNRTAVVTSDNNCLGIIKKEKIMEWFSDICKKR